MSVERIRSKLKQSGMRGLVAAGAHRVANFIDAPPRVDQRLAHQALAHLVLSRYVSLTGKHILEVGGAQACVSVMPFLRDGAASAIVSGLGHIDREVVSDQYDLRVQRANALELSSVFGHERFDIVYGLSIIEHIPSPELFLDELHAVLKPGGLAYLEGNPLWSSAKGHHLWVEMGENPKERRATANYLFDSSWPAPSTNPLPDWSHLLMTPDEMRSFLMKNAIPTGDIDCIIEWVFDSDGINRIGLDGIAHAYTGSRLAVLEANTARVDVPPTTLSELRQRHGGGIDYGIAAVSYVLKKAD
jgi:SAM-dependent methyltransferase